MTTPMTNNNPTDDHGLSAQLEVLEAMTAPSDAENQQLICLLLELKRRRENQNVLEAELQQYRKAAGEPVADVVAWSKSGEERTCDIRWRRFDVAPGPLYTLPPSAMVGELITSFNEVLRISDRDHEAWTRAKAAIQLFATSEQPEPATVMICDLCGHDAFLGENDDWYTCDEGHSFQVRSEPPTTPYSLPPHLYRELVNSLRDTSEKYQGTQQLREQLHKTLRAVITPVAPPPSTSNEE